VQADQTHISDAAIVSKQPRVKRRLRWAFSGTSGQLIGLTGVTLVILGLLARTVTA
jgi:hypothetical protein